MRKAVLASSFPLRCSERAGLPPVVPSYHPVRGPANPESYDWPIQREPSLFYPDLAPTLSSADIPPIAHNALMVQNERGRWVPQLAAEPLSIENGTWRVRDDGGMETIWRIRSGVRWHDGVPFTSADLLFSFATAK